MLSFCEVTDLFLFPLARWSCSGDSTHYWQAYQSCKVGYTYNRLKLVRLVAEFLDAVYQAVLPKSA